MDFLIIFFLTLVNIFECMSNVCMADHDITQTGLFGIAVHEITNMTASLGILTYREGDMTSSACHFKSSRCTEDIQV